MPVTGVWWKNWSTQSTEVIPCFPSRFPLLWEGCWAGFGQQNRDAGRCGAIPRDGSWRQKASNAAEPGCCSGLLFSFVISHEPKPSWAQTVAFGVCSPPWLSAVTKLGVEYLQCWAEGDTRWPVWSLCPGDRVRKGEDSAALPALSSALLLLEMKVVRSDGMSYMVMRCLSLSRAPSITQAPPCVSQWVIWAELETLVSLI